MKPRLFVLGFALLLMGCANSFEAFYRPAQPPREAFAQYAGTPQITISDTDSEATVLHMYQEGYGLLGYSAFRGPRQNREDAIAQAKRVGAAFIIIPQPDRGAESGSVTIQLRGAGGGSQGIVDQIALYFAPLRRQGIGLGVAAMTPRQQQELGTSQAMRVIVVRDGSPGARADIRSGDYVLTLDERAVHDVRSFNAAAAQAIGKKSEIMLIRKGQKISKSVAIPAAGW